MELVCGVASDEGIPPCMVVTVCGGSSSGHTTAAYLGSKPGLQVNVLTRRPEAWSDSKTLLLHTTRTPWESKGTIEGKLHKVTSDPRAVIPQSDIVIVCAPGHAQPDILRAIAPHVKQNAVLGSIFGEGGFDWAAREAFKGDWSKIDILFCLNNIPWLCRTSKYGHEVQLIGPKKSLWVAAWPPKRAVDAARLAALLYDIPCATVPNFISITLCPSNQIIHPGRYYGIFHDWDGVRSYKESEIDWGLYTGVDDRSAEWMQKLDNDLQAIKRALAERYPKLDLRSILPLGERIVKHYGDAIADKSSLKQIFRTNSCYAGCKTPAVPTPDGFKPAVNSRLFDEDIPFGLCVLKNIAEMLNIDTPSIDFQIEWHQKWMGKTFIDVESKKLNKSLIAETGTPERYGITSLDQLVAASLPQEG